MNWKSVDGYMKYSSWFNSIHDHGFKIINSNNNNTNNMTNLETKIEGLKNKKAGLSFTTDMETILSKKYAEIWMDIDSSYVKEMIQEELLNEDVVALLFNKKNKLVVVGRYDINNVWNKSDNQGVIINGQYSLNINEGWDYSQYDLSEILVVTDFDAYIDYQLEQKKEISNKEIESLNEAIEREHKNIEEEAEFYADAKRFGLKKVNKRTIRKLRKAELIKNNKASLEEIAELL